ncbi:hypothetical protein THARTR1_00685 [Trichoderma harzianum]|uniref:Uncharacterized protein n=1 Tax=Trichoderma harzianum TaxID=5544 RepID=A0A2K0UPU3_TRIHA|nr:hypothetical protein THARTR1_00685 [Trichoderma harzianum]
MQPHSTSLILPKAHDGNTADMRDETWMGCTIQQKSDGGCIILSPDSTPLLETEDAPKTMNKMDDHGNAVDAIRDDEFASFKLLARCTFLVTGSDNEDDVKEEDSSSKDPARLEKELKGTVFSGKTYVSAAYLGFSKEVKGPVFMRKEVWSILNFENYSRLPWQKPSIGPGPLVKLISGPVHKEAACFSLKGISLKCGPFSSSPAIEHQDVILHHLATTEANLVMLKRLVSGEPLETFLTTPEDRKAYDLYVERLIQGLKDGAAIAPFTFINPPELSDVPPGSCLSDRLQDDAKPCGDDNRPCNPTPSIRNLTYAAPAGFVYRAALTDAFEYPPELIRLLKEFALQYPNDCLPLRLMLLACHLWFDIITHPDLQLEWFMSERKGGEGFNEVPDVSLAAFLVYFAHWLSWTESMGLFEHPHPFRFVSRACESDQAHAGLAVKANHIPQDRVIALMRKVTCRIPDISIEMRINLLPCQMPGTKMLPIYHHFAAVVYPHPISLALTGLPHMGYLGLPKYTQLDLTDVAKQPEKRLRSHMLPYFVNSSLFANLGTRLPIPGDLSKGVFLSFAQISPFWKSNISMIDLEPSQPSHHSAELSSPGKKTVPLESQPLRESLFYVPLLESWSKIPQGTHWAWKHALQLLKDLPKEE